MWEGCLEYTLSLLTCTFCKSKTITPAPSPPPSPPPPPPSSPSPSPSPPASVLAPSALPDLIVVSFGGKLLRDDGDLEFDDEVAQLSRNRQQRRLKGQTHVLAGDSDLYQPEWHKAQGYHR